MFEQDKICQVLVQALGLQRWGRQGFSAVFWGRMVLCSVLRIVERSAVFPTPARKARGAPAQLWQPQVPSANAKYPLGIRIGPAYEVLSWTNEDLLPHELVFLPWERESQQTYFLEKRNKWEFPGSLVIKTELPLQEHKVQSLVGELKIPPSTWHGWEKKQRNFHRMINVWWN